MRASSDAADRAIVAAFGSLLADGPTPEPTFSVRFEEPEQEGHRPFQMLYRGDCQAIRTFHRSRVIDALRASLARFAGEGAGLFRLRQVVLAASGGAILIPSGLLPRVEEVEAELGERGIEVLDPAFAHLDPATGEVVVPEPAIPLDEEALRRIDGEGPPASSRRTLRLPVAHWAIIRRDRETALRRMDVFASLMPSIEEQADVPMSVAMEAVAKALTKGSVGAIGHHSGEKLLKRLTDLGA